MNLLLSPLSWLILSSLMIALGVLCARRWPQAAGVAIAVLALGAMTPLVANLLVGAIEQQATPEDDECKEFDVVVLLAGGTRREPTSELDFAALTPTSLARLLAFLERPERQGLPLIISGGGRYRIAEAALMASLLRRLDPADPPPRLEVQSRTTWESAQEVARLLPPPRRVALASSALHLSRARRAFVAAGYEVCRWPLDRLHVPARGLSALLPQSSSLRKTELALHELAGDLKYRWFARRHALKLVPHSDHAAVRPDFCRDAFAHDPSGASSAE